MRQPAKEQGQDAAWPLILPVGDRSPAPKSVLENWLFGRASVLASPDFQGFPEKLGLARTLALPRLGFKQALRAAVGAGDGGKAPAGAACDSHTEPSAAAGIDYSRVEGRPRAQRTAVTQDLICAP